MQTSKDLWLRPPCALAKMDMRLSEVVCETFFKALAGWMLGLNGQDHRTKRVVKSRIWPEQRIVFSGEKGRCSGILEGSGEMVTRVAEANLSPKQFVLLVG